MKVLIYTRPPENSSSIGAAHWKDALARNGLSDLDHDLVVCHAAEAAAEHLPTSQVVVSSRADLRALITPAHTATKFIFFAFAGVDHLAPFDWAPSGAWVVNNSGATSRAMGEYAAFALLLLANGHARPSSDYLSVVAAKGFASLAGRSVTVVGAGGVGAGVAAMCKTFRMQVRGVRRSGQPAAAFDTMHSPDELGLAVSQSDFVVLACPVTPQTRGLFGAALISQMKPGAGLVNMARSAILDEEALCDALDRGTLSGAVLDVVSAAAREPGSRVRGTPGVIVTPHMSGDDARCFIANSLDVLASNLRQFLANETPSNAVDFSLGY